MTVTTRRRSSCSLSRRSSLRSSSDEALVRTSDEALARRQRPLIEVPLKVKQNVNRQAELKREETLSELVELPRRRSGRASKVVHRNKENQCPPEQLQAETPKTKFTLVIQQRSDKTSSSSSFKKREAELLAQDLLADVWDKMMDDFVSVHIRQLCSDIKQQGRVSHPTATHSLNQGDEIETPLVVGGEEAVPEMSLQLLEKETTSQASPQLETGFDHKSPKKDKQQPESSPQSSSDVSPSTLLKTVEETQHDQQESRRRSKRACAGHEVPAVPMKFQVGDIVNAMDMTPEFKGKWFFAQIVHENKEQNTFRVHYFGYEELFDEAFSTQTPHIRPLDEVELARCRRKHGKEIRTLKDLLADAERLSLPWKVEEESEPELEVVTQEEEFTVNNKEQLANEEDLQKETIEVKSELVETTYLAYNPSGCARADIFRRQDRFTNPIYRSRIHPIRVEGLSKLLRPLIYLNHGAKRDVTLEKADSSLDNLEVDTKNKTTANTTNLSQGRHSKPSNNASFFVSDLGNNLPMVLRYRQLGPLAKRRLRVAKSLIHGLGIYAIETIESHDMVIEYIGEIIGQNVANRREKENEARGVDMYMFRIDYDEIVDATWTGNAARFINHCCQPNCFSKIITIDGRKRIMILAARKILAGEELTYDYKMPLEKNKIPCFCGSPACRGTMN